MTVYGTLFLAAFLAATLLPFYSEVALAGFVVAGHDKFWLWFWASTGNTLGAAVNWALARFCLRYEDRRWFPFRRDRLGRAQQWFQRYGTWSLLLAWAPVGGDALTFVAGLMRVRFALFLLLVGIGKAARYAFVLGAVAAVT